VTPAAARLARGASGIAMAVFLAFAVPLAAAAAALGTLRLAGAGRPGDHPLASLYVQHGWQLVLALIVIAAMKRLLPIDYGLHFPRGKTYVGPAILWGAAFGILMLAVDYAPQMLAHNPPALDYRLTFQNVAGWLGFEGLYVGPTEEIPFRSMLVPFLAAMLPTRLSLGRFDMRWAGIVIALIFALLHATSFASRPWPIALGQQAYAFALGVLYAYWLEKSGSILAPIVAHNLSDVVEYILLFAWVGLA
jgi:hypothetical protein